MSNLRKHDFSLFFYAYIMLDTIKISILKEQNENIYKFCIENCNNIKNGFIISNKKGVFEETKLFRFTQIDYDNSQYQIINGKVCNPSSTYSTTYQILEDRINLEVSLPKFIYTTNSILLINHHTGNNQNYYLNFRNALKYFLDTIFLGYKVNLQWVLIERFDICFNQYFKSYKESIQCINYLKLKHKSINTKTDYKAGLIDVSKNSYQKIYHKGIEFMKKDYKFLKDEKNINDLINFSSDCLRYERQYKPSNWSYTYLTKFSKHKPFHKLYKLQKKQGRIDKDLRQRFESRIKFTIEQNHELEKTYKNVFMLSAEYFNFLTKTYLDYIKLTYTLSKNSTDDLTKTLFDLRGNLTPKEKGEKTTRLNILAKIKLHGSLEKAKELGTINRSTYKRYKDYLALHNISTTKVPIDIYQDFSLNLYYQKLAIYNIQLFNVSNKIRL